MNIQTLTAKIHDRKVAILFIDMQLGFMRDVFGSAKLLNGVEALLSDVAGKAECVHIGCGIQNKKPSYGDVALRKNNPFINDQLNSLASIYLYEIPNGHPICLKDKYTANGFDKTGLADYLHERGIDTVLVCGVYDDFCVRDTAEGARLNGLNVVYLSDLIRGHFLDLYKPDPAEQLAVHQSLYTDGGLVIQSSDLKLAFETMPARVAQPRTAKSIQHIEQSVPAAN